MSETHLMQLYVGEKECYELFKIEEMNDVAYRRAIDSIYRCS